MKGPKAMYKVCDQTVSSLGREFQAPDHGSCSDASGSWVNS